MDVYRLGAAEDFLELGAEEMLYGDGISVIEWSEKIMNELPAGVIIIKLEASGNERTVTVENWPYGDLSL